MADIVVNEKIYVTVDIRILENLIPNCNNIIKEINELEIEFQRVDNIISTIKEGDIFYYEDCDGGFEMNWFEQKFIKIIDGQTGQILCEEPNTVGKPKSMRCIRSMKTEAEFMEMIERIKMSKKKV